MNIFLTCLFNGLYKEYIWLHKEYERNWSKPKKYSELTPKEIKVIINNSKKLKEDTLKNRSYFILSEDMKKQKKVFKGPFKRSIKKIPNHGKPM